MSVTSGFFNSLNGDRKYNAEQMSSIFDGIINDGIFANIGTAFSVNADTGNNITVGIGRAWFNSAWIYNDAILPLTTDDSEVLLDRYDAVIIEVDHSDSVRAGSIKVVKGSPGSSPVYPEMTHTTSVHQYPLAYIYRKANTSEITQANITSMIGTSSCPYVTGILQVQNIDNIVAQWQAQFSEWSAEEQNTFNTWFTNIQNQLSEDAAGNLQNQIGILEELTTDVKTNLVLAINDLLEKAVLTKGGDTIDGDLYFSRNGVTKGWVAAEENDMAFNFIAKNDAEGIQRYLNIRASADVALKDALRFIGDGVSYGVFGEHNPPKASDIVEGVFPIARGGTGYGNRADAMNSLGFIGTNPIASTSNDTVAKWAALGSGYAWYSASGYLNNQPSTYGMLLNLVLPGNNEVTQLWKCHSTGALYVRSGNSSGWGQAWAKVYDSLNKPTASDIGAAASSHNQSASTITTGTFNSTATYAKTGTDYTTYRIRNIAANTSAMTASSTALTNGNIYLQYS